LIFIGDFFLTIETVVSITVKNCIDCSFIVPRNVLSNVLCQLTYTRKVICSVSDVMRKRRDSCCHYIMFFTGTHQNGIYKFFISIFWYIMTVLHLCTLHYEETKCNGSLTREESKGSAKFENFDLNFKLTHEKRGSGARIFRLWATRSLDCIWAWASLLYRLGFGPVASDRSIIFKYVPFTVYTPSLGCYFYFGDLQVKQLFFDKTELTESLSVL
jgi:hypothetical protein